MYNLTNERGETIQIGQHHWRPMLALAEMYGWTPLGTIATAEVMEGGWEGNYCTKDGQQIRAIDAEKIAATLELALDDIPDFRTAPLLAFKVSNLDEPMLYEEKRYRDHPAFKNRPVTEPITIKRHDRLEIDEAMPDVLLCEASANYQPTPIDIWSGEHKATLLQFITFARGGWVQIN